MSVQVPVILEADVLVIGGTLQGCQLARRLRDAARRVILACEGDALGVDGPGQLLPTRGDRPADALALEDTLLEAGAQILYDAFPLRPLREANGPQQIAGWIFFGAGGYFAISAKAVVDATPTGHLPFQARLTRRSTGTSPCVLQWSLLGSAKEPAAAASGIRLEVSLTPKDTPEGPRPLCHATRELRLRPTDLPARLDAESALRAALWGPHVHKGAEWCAWEGAEDPWKDITPSREIPLFRHSTAQVPTLLRYTLPQVPAPAAFQNAEARRALPEGESLVFQGKSPRPHAGCPTVRLDLESLNPQEAACPPPRALILGAGETGCAAALQAQKEGLSYLLAEASGATALPPDRLAPDETHRLWHHCRLGGVLLKNGVLAGSLLLAATGEACLVRAGAFLDATGTAQFAWALGAPMLHPHEPEIISQHCALAPRLHYASQQTLRPARQRALDPQDHACQILRARRDAEASHAFRVPPRIRGDLTLMPQDLLLETHHDDALALLHATLPKAAEASHPLLWLLNDAVPKDAVVPLPAGVFLSPRHQNLLTLGDALSAHTDLRAMLATPESHRIQGRLAARLAAYALAHNLSFREVPATAIRENPPETPAEKNALSPQAEALSHAFLRPDQSRRVLQAAFESHPDTQTALLLAFLGDSSGRRLLAQEFATGNAAPAHARLLLQALAIIGTPATPLLDGLPTDDALPALLPGLLGCLAHWPGAEAVPLLERLLAGLPATQPHNPEGPHTENHCREILVARVLAACAPNHEEALRVLEAAQHEWPLALALPALSFLSHKPATHAKP